jgi:hypothetical protein
MVLEILTHLRPVGDDVNAVLAEEIRSPRSSRGATRRAQAFGGLNNRLFADPDLTGTEPRSLHPDLPTWSKYH